MLKEIISQTEKALEDCKLEVIKDITRRVVNAIGKLDDNSKAQFFKQHELKLGSSWKVIRDDASGEYVCAVNFIKMYSLDPHETIKEIICKGATDAVDSVNGEKVVVEVDDENTTFSVVISIQ